jgi:flavin-dependent dehydrogenase
MQFDFDVIVIGAGPGGTTSAYYAALNGWKVLLIDQAKFPRDKICGDVLMLILSLRLGISVKLY